MKRLVILFAAIGAVVFTFSILSPLAISRTGKMSSMPAFFIEEAEEEFTYEDPFTESHPQDSDECAPAPNNNLPRIQVAILLDTSSSMDGLIEQVKARLWNIVNTLTCLRFNGETPMLEISLYEYGNSNLSSSSNWIRLVTPFTSDLDLLSEQLFALRTCGGSEYCGAVINRSIKDLKWTNGDKDIRMIYIAGNEPFTQGRIHYAEAISSAVEKGVTVNTIHCGDEQTGIHGSWRDGAIRGKGKYFFIDHNVRVVHIDTPFDVRISDCNKRLNTTYISYGGSEGYARQQNQIAQDANAMGVSSANFAERAVSKSKVSYRNSSWDLVDYYIDDSKALSKIKNSELPKEYQNKTTAELQKIIEDKIAERENIRKEIAELAKQRQAYIDEKTKASDSSDDLGNAINLSVIEVANAKGYKMVK